MDAFSEVLLTPLSRGITKYESEAYYVAVSHQKEQELSTNSLH